MYVYVYIRCLSVYVYMSTRYMYVGGRDMDDNAKYKHLFLPVFFLITDSICFYTQFLQCRYSISSVCTTCLLG